MKLKKGGKRNGGKRKKEKLTGQRKREKMSKTFEPEMIEMRVEQTNVGSTLDRVSVSLTRMGLLRRLAQPLSNVYRHAKRPTGSKQGQWPTVQRSKVAGHCGLKTL